MLYDPKWEVEAKPGVFSVESLIAWLETQDSAREYEWANCEGFCLLSQYLTAMGKHPATDYKHLDVEMRCEVACALPYTFGAALDRARKFRDR